MRHRLRIHQEQFDDGNAPVTYQFPTAMAAARERLVAGVVSVPPTPDSEAQRGDPLPKGVLARIDARPSRRKDDRVVSTDGLIRQVERTLDRMQERIDLLNEDVDQVFKFPIQHDDDDRPWAA